MNLSLKKVVSYFLINKLHDESLKLIMKLLIFLIKNYLAVLIECLPTIRDMIIWMYWWSINLVKWYDKNKIEIQVAKICHHSLSTFWKCLENRTLLCN